MPTYADSISKTPFGFCGSKRKLQTTCRHALNCRTLLHMSVTRSVSTSFHRTGIRLLNAEPVECRNLDDVGLLWRVLKGGGNGTQAKGPGMVPTLRWSWLSGLP